MASPGPAPPRRRPVPGPQPISLGHNTALRQPGPLPQPPFAWLPPSPPPPSRCRRNGPGRARVGTAAGPGATTSPRRAPGAHTRGEQESRSSREERAPRPAGRPHAARRGAPTGRAAAGKGRAAGSGQLGAHQKDEEAARVRQQREDGGSHGRWGAREGRNTAPALRGGSSLPPSPGNTRASSSAGPRAPRLHGSLPGPRAAWGTPGSVVPAGGGGGGTQ